MWSQVAQTILWPSLSASVVMMLSIWPILNMSFRQVMRAFEFIAVFAPVFSVALVYMHAGWTRPLRFYLDQRRAGEPVDDDELGAAFRSATAFPQRQFIPAIACWWIGGIGAAYWIAHTSDAFNLDSAIVLWCAAAMSGFVASVLQYIGLKNNFEPVRNQIARELSSPELRRRWVRPLPLSQKLVVAIFGMVVITLLFGVSATRVRSERDIEHLASTVQLEALNAMLERIDSGDSVSEVIAQAAVQLPPSVGIFVFVPEAGDFEGDLLYPVELELIRSAETGNSLKIDSDTCFSWVPLPSGGSLVAVSGLESIRSESMSSRLVLGFLVLVSSGVVFLGAWLISKDLKKSLGHVVDQIGLVAAGDLSGGAIHESEDEMGELSRVIDEMTIALRGIVMEVAYAADQVGDTSTEMGEASQSVARSSTQQILSVKEIQSAMRALTMQMEGLAESSGKLSEAVADSTVSVRELKSTSSELDGTAAALSGKSEETSDSIHGLIMSIAAVSESSVDTADAAAQASTSMEEMAASVLSVDGKAAETGALSENVVAVSQEGRERVARMTAGMEEIRQSTETAETVVKTLGERTQEIGDITQVISGVADETNLLALNASIIAAQAGEHGRAFAVVADEIKMLADRVLTNTKEIGGVIGALQEEGVRAVGVIGQGAGAVKTGVALTAEAGESLEQIAAAARDSGTRISEIMMTVGEQAESAAHVSELIQSVNQQMEGIRSATQMQTSGAEIVGTNSTDSLELSQIVNRAATEQADSSSRIDASFQNVLGAVERIEHALQEQATASQRVGEHIMRVSEETQSNGSAAQQMAESVSSLSEQAKKLQDRVRRFRI